MRFYRSILAFFAALLLILSLHKPIITFVLHKYLKEKVSFNGLTIQRKALIFSNIIIKNEKWKIITDKITIGFNDIIVEHPIIDLIKSDVLVHKKDRIAWRKFLKTNLVISNGLINLQEQDKVKFSFYHNHLVISLDTSCINAYIDNEKICGEIKDIDLNRIAKIAIFLDLKLGNKFNIDTPIINSIINTPVGVNLVGSNLVGPNFLSNITGWISGLFSIEEDNGSFNGHIKALTFFKQYQLPSLTIDECNVKASRQSCYASFSNGSIEWNKNFVKNISGNISLNNRDNLKINIKGNGGNLNGKINLKNYSGHLNINLLHDGTIKIKSSLEDSKLLFSLKTNKLNCNYLNIIKNSCMSQLVDVDIKKGFLTSAIEIKGKDITNIKATLRDFTTTFKGRNITIPKAHLHGDMQQGDINGDIVLMSDGLKAKSNIKINNWQTVFTASADAQGLKANTKLTGDINALQGQVKILYYSKNKKKKQEKINLSATVKLNDKKKLFFAGTAQHYKSNDSIVFVATSNDIFNSKNVFDDLWIRGNSICLDKWYVKNILSLLNDKLSIKDAKVNGNVNLFIQLNGNILSCNFLGSDIHLSNDNITIGIDKLKKSGFASYNLKDGHLHAFIDNLDAYGFIKDKNVKVALSDLSIVVDNNKTSFLISQAHVADIDNKKEGVDFSGRADFYTDRDSKIGPAPSHASTSFKSSASPLLLANSGCFDLLKSEAHGLARLPFFESRSVYFCDNKIIPKFGLVIDDIKGNVDCLNSFISLPCKGDISGRLFFSNIKEQIELQTDLVLKKASATITPILRLDNIQAHLIVNTNNDVFQIEDGYGDIYIKDKKYSCICSFLNKIYDIKISDSIYDIVKLEGFVEQVEDGFSVSIDPLKTKILSTTIKADKLIFNKDGHLKYVDIHVKSNVDDIAQLCTPFLPKEINFKRGDIKGFIDIDVNTDEAQRLVINVGADNVHVYDRDFNKMQGHIAYGQNQWKGSFYLDDWHLDLCIKENENDWSFEDIKGRYKEHLIFRALGKYHIKNQSFDAEIKDININLKDIDYKADTSGKIKGSAILSANKEGFSSCLSIDLDHVIFNHIAVINKQPMEIYFSTKKGLVIEKVNVDLYDDTFDLFPISFKTAEIVYDQTKWMFNKANVIVPIDLIRASKRFDPIIPMKKFFLRIFKGSGTIKADMDMEYDNGSLNGKAEMVRINDYELRKCIFTFSDNHNVLSYENEYKNKKIKFVHEIFPSFSCGKTIVSLDGSNDIVSIGWQYHGDDFSFKDIDGVFGGVEMHFFDENDKLAGNFKINIAKASGWLSDEIRASMNKFMIDANCDLKGYLKLDVEKEPFFQFSGILSMKDFSVCGYVLKNMLANIEMDPNHIYLDNLKLSDRSGFLHIDKIRLDKKDNDDWACAMNQLQLKDFRPSLLRAKNKVEEEMKPLVVRELELLSFAGRFKDILSFEGNGYVNFINSFKRKKSVLDAPSNFLGSIFGADLELHTPVQGKIEYKIKDGKIYLTNLEDAYSEGKRSQFFLFYKDMQPYIAFNGDINIDIRMQQYVVFKFTENFIISLRGTVFNPKSSLVKKRFFE
jgi:hypothetical protein